VGWLTGDGAESLDKAFVWMLVTPGMWTVTARELRSSASSRSISGRRCTISGSRRPLEDGRRADGLSDRTWKVIVVAMEGLQDRKETRMGRTSECVDRLAQLCGANVP
jgi:hypothetical protein